MWNRGGCRTPDVLPCCRPVKHRLLISLVAAVTVATPALATPARPVVLVQAGHVSPGEPGYSAQTGASGGPFGSESAFTTRLRADVIAQLTALGVDARPLNARVEPLGVAGATFVSLHHDSAGGAAAIGRAVTGGGENWYHGEGFGTASQRPYGDSGAHRTPATTVSATVERRSTSLARRIAARLGAIHTARNGARASFSGLVPRNSNPRMNHFYGYYRTNAGARVLVEAGAAGTDNVFLAKTSLIARAITQAITDDLRARGLR